MNNLTFVSPNVAKEFADADMKEVTQWAELLKISSDCRGEASRVTASPGAPWAIGASPGAPWTNQRTDSGTHIPQS